MTGVQHRMIGIGCGVAAASYMSQITDRPEPAMIVLASSAIGCMLPDIDHDSTRLGRKRKKITSLLSYMVIGMGLLGISAFGGMYMTSVREGAPDENAKIALIMTLGMLGLYFLFKILGNTEIVQWMKKHRGFTHTLIIPIIFCLISIFTGNIFLRYSCIGLIIGYVSHLFADMLTVKGCPIFWPITPKSISILKLRTGSALTWLVAILLSAIPITAVVIKNF